jgi:C1A family cysteine protease
MRIEPAPPPSDEESLAGMGRRAAPDKRDQDYLLPKKRVSPLITKRYWTTRPPVLDQGGTSQCVIYALDKWLTTFPVYNVGFRTAADRTRVYKEVQKRDEWPGENYDGTSVRAGFKYLKELGLCSEYRWAFDLSTVVSYVLSTGPMELGTDWTMDMFMPDHNGYIWPTGRNAGGHAWLLKGVNLKRRNPNGTVGAGRLLNSWGDGWGENGMAWMTFETLERLIHDQGEAAVATEVKMP